MAFQGWAESKESLGRIRSQLDSFRQTLVTRGPSIGRHHERAIGRHHERAIFLLQCLVCGQGFLGCNCAMEDLLNIAVALIGNSIPPIRKEHRLGRLGGVACDRAALLFFASACTGILLDKGPVVYDIGHLFLTKHQIPADKFEFEQHRRQRSSDQTC